MLGPTPLDCVQEWSRVIHPKEKAMNSNDPFRKVTFAFVLVASLAIAGPAHATCPASPGTNQVIVYEHSNVDPTKRGACAVLDIGSYLNPPFGSGANVVGNDIISSIAVGAGVSADLYQNSNRSGVLYHYENGPFWYSLGGWANDDVSSIRIYARTPNAPSDTHKTFTYSASGTNSATNAQTKTFELGTLKAGMTVRVGTCSGGGDLPSARATGDTYVRVLFNGFEGAYDDDTCPSNASYVSYTLPYSGSVTIKAGCYSSLSCSGTVEVAYDHPDSSGSITSVESLFAAIVGNSPKRNKLNFRQAREAFPGHAANPA
jgi:hypothetical protein